MGDFSDNYTQNKKAYIFFNLKNKTIKLKPFIDSFSFTFTSKFNEDKKNIYLRGIKPISYESGEYSLKFNVLATNVNEAIENHEKYQKLLRMMLPMRAKDLAQPKKMSVLFTNLISSKGQSGSNVFDISKAFTCIISNLNYSPIMELGFFEYNGLLFAKGFSLDVKMVSTVKANKQLPNLPIFHSGYSYGRTFAVSSNQDSEPAGGPNGSEETDTDEEETDTDEEETDTGEEQTPGIGAAASNVVQQITEQTPPADEEELPPTNNSDVPPDQTPLNAAEARRRFDDANAD